MVADGRSRANPDDVTTKNCWCQIIQITWFAKSGCRIGVRLRGHEFRLHGHGFRLHGHGFRSYGQGLGSNHMVADLVQAMWSRRSIGVRLHGHEFRITWAAKFRCRIAWSRRIGEGLVKDWIGEGYVGLHGRKPHGTCGSRLHGRVCGRRTVPLVTCRVLTPVETPTGRWCP